MEIPSRVLDYTKLVTCGSMEAARVLLIPRVVCQRWFPVFSENSASEGPKPRAESVFSEELEAFAVTPLMMPDVFLDEDGIIVDIGGHSMRE